MADSTLAGLTAATLPIVATDLYATERGSEDLKKVEAGSALAGYVVVADSTSATCNVALFESATGNLAPKTDGGLTYNAATGTLTAGGFSGPLTGNVTGNCSGSSGSTTGNAATATALANPRAIYGNNFDGTAALTQVIASTYGGTGNGFTKISGPTTAERTKTMRDASDTVLELGGSYTPTGTWTSLTLVTPALGTPASGNLANCTFPTLNQNTSGSAASLSISGQSGLMTVTGLTSSNRAKTVRDAADTILELGGSYTPTGTWTSLTLVTPALGTPASGVLTSCTGLPPAGQTTAGRTFTIGFGKDGGGSTLSTSTIATAWTAPVGYTIVGYNLSADAGTFTVKFWKIAAGTAIPTISDVINTSGLSLASGTHLRSSTTSDFTTTTITAGDIIMCAITAVATATWITVGLEVTKS
jgi:hypothetical protein